MSGGYRTRCDVTVTVPAPNARYLDELFALRCCGDLAAFFPNAKEVTESFACFNAVRKTFGPAILGDDSITCICPGDGTKPRTAAVFALRSSWAVKSVDPLMATQYVRHRHHIRRLVALRAQAESVRTECERAMVVSCHSHARLSAVLGTITADRVDVVSLPCCVPDDIGEPTRTWRDLGCWSPENRVNVYEDWRAA